MSCDSSLLSVQTVESDHEDSLDEYLNDFKSSSSDEIIEDPAESNTIYDGNHIPTLPPMFNENNVPNPEDPEGTLSLSNVQNLRSYLQKQCYDGCKWTSSLKFEGSRDKQVYQQMEYYSL